MNFSKTAVVCVAALAAIALGGCQNKSAGQPATAASTHAATAATSSGPAAQGTAPSTTQSSASTPVTLPSFDAQTDAFVIEDDMRAIIATLAKNAVGVPDDLRHPDIQSVGLDVCGIHNGGLSAGTCQEGGATTPNGKFYLYISAEGARKQFNLGGHGMTGVRNALVSAYADYVVYKQAQRVKPGLIASLDGLTEADSKQRVELIICTYGEVLGGMRKTGTPLSDVEQQYANILNSTFYQDGAAGKPCI